MMMQIADCHWAMYPLPGKIQGWNQGLTDTGQCTPLPEN